MTPGDGAGFGWRTADGGCSSGRTTKHPRRWWALLAPVLVAAACSGSDSGSDATGSSGGLEQLLALAPASVFNDPDNAAELFYVDLEGIRDEAGLGDASPEQLVEELPQALLDQGARAPELFFQDFTSIEAFESAFGFSVLDVERSLDLTAPPHRVNLLEVTVDEETIDDAVHADPAWSDRLTVDELRGHTFYDWDEGEEGPRTDLERVTVGRPLGSGGQLAVVDDVAVRTVTRSSMDATLEAVDDPAASVAELDAVIALLDGTTSLDGDVRQALVQAPPLPGWAGPALFVEASDGALHTARAVLSAPDEDTADAAAEVVRATLESGTSDRSGEPYTDILPDATVTTEGTLVILESSTDLAFDHLVGTLRFEPLLTLD